MDRRVALLIAAFILSLSYAAAQQAEIKADIDSVLARQKFYPNFSLLEKDVDFSFSYFASSVDTVSMQYKERFNNHFATFLKYVPKPRVELRKQFIGKLIELAKNEELENAGYIIGPLFLYTDIHEFDSTHIEAMKDARFYRGTSWRLPLLIAALNMKSEIPKLKEWGKTTNPNHWLYQHNVKAALARMGDEETIVALVAREFDLKIDEEHIELIKHFDILNFVRRRETTEKLFQYLYDDRDIVVSEWGDGTKEYGKVYGFALYHLQMVVEDFPCKISHSDLYLNYGKREMTDEKVRIAREWYANHRYDYKVISNPDNFDRFKN